MGIADKSRKAQAMMAAAVMKAEIDKLPKDERARVQAYLEEFRVRGKVDLMFDAALKIYAVETQISEKVL